MVKQKKLPNGNVVSVGSVFKGEVQEGYQKTVQGKFRVKNFGDSGENSVTLEQIGEENEITLSISDLSTHLKRDFLERVS